MWERGIFQNFLRLLEGVTLGVGRDMWRWRPGEDGVFPVKSCYKLLEGLWLVHEDMNRMEEVLFGYLW